MSGGGEKEGKCERALYNYYREIQNGQVKRKTKQKKKTTNINNLYL
jgi:hypothetical protein